MRITFQKIYRECVQLICIVCPVVEFTGIGGRFRLNFISTLPQLAQRQVYQRYFGSHTRLLLDLWLCVCLFLPLSILVLYDLYYSFTTHTSKYSAVSVACYSLPIFATESAVGTAFVQYLRRMFVKEFLFLRKESYKPTFFPLFIQLSCLFYS